MEMASKILGQLAIWRIDSKNFIEACLESHKQTQKSKMVWKNAHNVTDTICIRCKFDKDANIKQTLLLLRGQ